MSGVLEQAGFSSPETMAESIKSQLQASTANAAVAQEGIEPPPLSSSSTNNCQNNQVNSNLNGLADTLDRSTSTGGELDSDNSILYGITSSDALSCDDDCKSGDEEQSILVNEKKETKM